MNPVARLRRLRRLRGALLLPALALILISAHAGNVVYGVDPVSGRVTTATLPDGTVITYGYDANGNRTSATLSPDITAPTAPSALTATPISQTQINLSWTQSSDTRGVTNYRVERCQSASCTYGEIAQPTAASYSDSSAAVTVNYSYRVRAVDAANNFSGYSNIVTAATVDTTAPTAPGTPTFPTANITATGAKANWAASNDNVGVTGYQYSLNNGAWTNTGSSAATFTMTTLTASTTYTFKVRARDAAGNFSAGSANGSFTTLAAVDTTVPTTPGTPSFPAATITATGAVANWTASSDNVAVTGYQYSLNNGAWLDTSSAAATYTIGGLTGSTTYTFKVRARDAAGNFSVASPNGSFSTSDTTVPSTPGTPTFPSATITATGATANWTPSTDNIAVTGYQYRLNGGTWTNTGSAAATFNISGLSASTAYTFAVRARDAAGNFSVASANGSFTTTATADTTVPTPPGTPTFPAASISATGATANWTASTDNIAVTGYQYSLNSGAWTDTGSALTTFNISGLTGSTSYTFKVRARDAAGNFSVASGNGSFTTSDTTPPTVPGTPTFPAANISASGATANWTASSDNIAVTGYQYSLNGGSWADTGSASATFSIGGLSGSTTYTFAVRARDAAGNFSAASGNGSFTTSDTTPPTTPGTPTFPAANISATGATATWTGSTDNVAVTGYQYSLNGGTWTDTGSSAATFAMGGLSGSTTYTFAVRARDAAGNFSSASGTGSFTTNDTTPPTTPGTPTFPPASISATGATANWAASSDNIAVTGYQYSLNGSAWTDTGSPTATFTLGGLSGSSNYTFAVRARDAAGNFSGSSGGGSFTTSDTTPPTTPGTPAFAAITVTSATVDWAASSDNVGVAGYDYSFNGGAWTSTGNTATGMSLSGLTGSTTYTLAVRARDAAGNVSSASGTGSFMTNAPPDTTSPGPPGTPTFSAITATAATASWSAATDNVGVTSYEYSINSGAWTNVGGALSANLSGLSAATTYTIQVRAVDAATNAGTSSSAPLTTIAQITISNRTVTVHTQPGSPQEVYLLHSLGDIWASPPSSIPPVDTGADWLAPKVGMSNFQAMATVIGGTCGAGSYGTWLGLGAGPSWGRSGIGTCIFTLQIRHSANPSVILGTAQITLTGN